MGKIKYIALLLILFSLSSCQLQNDAVIMPSGKLPWPHQPPDIDNDKYNQLIQDLFIQTNLGEFQGGPNHPFCYIHDGLDIMIPNGTKIYAIESGYVRDIRTGTNGFGHIVISDAVIGSGFGWNYAHTRNFQFKVGDHVNQGDYIAEVYYPGADHLELVRIHVEGDIWSDVDLYDGYHSERYFVFHDNDPPRIFTPFYFFKNNSDTVFPRLDNTPPIISGDVDIVVGMHDRGEYARGDNLSSASEGTAVTRIEYEITGPAMPSVKKISFDFTKIIIRWVEPGLRERTLAVHKPYWLFPETHEGNSCYYIITNTPGTEPPDVPQGIAIAQRDYAWNTAEKDAYGTPRFPDGLYTITVTAYDSSGHRCTVSDQVMVANGD